MVSALQTSLLLFSLLIFLQITVAANTTFTCRCMPGDVCWPSRSTWDRFNTTVDGRLIATVPQASVCHDPHYDEAACAVLKEGWDLTQTFYPHASEIMDPYSQNQSCDPFTSRSSPCQLGNYVAYSVNVSSAADVAAGLQFAQEHGLRAVIKNTGHDYLGKSTGRGAIALWTHNLKSQSFFNYSSSAYTGPAAKFGAGVQGYDILVAAAAHGLRIVSGDCATVGYAGGYLQGGGHSALSSTYGMAADQVLEWEVMTANGTRLIATPTQEADLYWALSGGGGGTYGVVLSVTVKAFKDGVMGGASLSFNTSSISDDTFWQAVTAFHASLPAIVDSGAGVLYSLEKTSFIIIPLTSPMSSKDDMSAILQPFVSALNQLEVPFSLTITSFPTYLEHFSTYLGPLPNGNPLINPIAYTLAGSLISRSVVENSTSNAAFTEVMRQSVQPGGGFMTGGIALKATHEVAGNDASSNAVLPAWRDAIVSVLAFAPWNYTGTLMANHAAQNYLVNVTVPALKAFSPDGGAYLNEANFLQSDWQHDFYGSNYDRLKSIKKRYDPEDLLYAVTAVGSEAWELRNDQRLCRT
ncbi:FAD-binding domain-containing protein [Lentithecium fluviatile CBS 122367]|uniref:FAD-binding domain-containing protein n=1 Tax=Lentithecium fluviatile CBS 122367 TaxID=1168545 RepID=A0A6G1IET4_9PLEO|nr:FAD-binding domain-containing protein [Lentithecium fluviatile CBS 122367]